MAGFGMSTQVQMLLKPAEPALAEQYFQQLIQHLGVDVEVRNTPDGKGRGVFTKQDLKADALVFKEPPLVGMQHSANKADALVCSRCFSMIGSIEQQIAHRLLASEESGSHTVNRDYLRGLWNGAAHLPCTGKFPLPELETCLGGCTDNVYCSASCAEADWASCHSLMCSGPPKQSSEWSGDPDESTSSSGGEHASTSRNRMSFDDFSHARELQRAPGLASLVPAMKVVPPNVGKAEAIRAFKAHADATNDIFHIAALVIARTILLASRLAAGTSTPGKVPAGEAALQDNWKALLEAWKPFQVAWKVPWWDCVAVPEDVNDEAGFRTDLKELAGESLNLLKAFLYDERFPALFELDLYGSIIGMFELNNLSLYVASPVEEYAIAATVDTEGGFDPTEQHMAHLIAKPLLDSLGDSYAAACEGSCFYALQSCCNHSCAPNAHAFKRRGVDTDGSAVILAKENIAAGDEVCLSYIDEAAPYSERQTALRDYGFTCKCRRCAAEAASAGKVRA